MRRTITNHRVASSQSGPALGLARSWLVIGAAAAGLAACADGYYSISSPFGNAELPEIQTGVFKDSNVAGLDFVSGDQMGVTDAGGRFTCKTGQPVSFSIGNIELGEADCATLVHPAALTMSGSLVDPKALNITRLLMLLDEDQMPENGIAISSALRAQSNSWEPIDLSAENLEEELVSIVADIASVESRPVVTVPSNADAYVHLDSSLSCAYSGVFVNTLWTAEYAALTSVALMVYREPGTTTDVFATKIVRNHPQAQLYVEAAGTVELKSLPSLIPGDSSYAGSVSAEFRTPDRVAGRWMNAFAQRAIDFSGAFEVFRIGDASGTYRFTGSYSRLAGTTYGTSEFGYLVFTMDGDEMIGEAFDGVLGYRIPISGSRLPNSDQVEFRIGNGDLSSLTTLTFDESGVPIALEGGWPGVEGSTLRAVACRLN